LIKKIIYSFCHKEQENKRKALKIVIKTPWVEKKIKISARSDLLAAVK